MWFSVRCAGCNQPGSALCARCRFSLASSAPVRTGIGVVAAMPFEGVARQVLLGLKYRNHRSVAGALAAHLLRSWAPGEVDVVTWAPTSGARARGRGFDQAELLARAVARELGVPCRRMLFRTHGQPQTGRSREERLDGPGYRGRSPRSGLRVLLIDDVVTTGATLAAACEALQLAGVQHVIAVAAAATPGRAQLVSPAHSRTVATAGSGSSSTTTARMPTPSAASTLVGTSSRKAVRPASAPNLSRAS